MKDDSVRKLRQAHNRAKLLGAAREAFDRAGYEGASMRGIARAAGLSTGAIFANWTDKPELYREVYGHAPISPEQGKKLVSALQGLGVDPTLVLAA